MAYPPNICPKYEKSKEIIYREKHWKARLYRVLLGIVDPMTLGNRNPLYRIVLCFYNRCLLPFREAGQEVSSYAPLYHKEDDIGV